jgi:hypothetical protein
MRAGSAPGSETSNEQVELIPENQQLWTESLLWDKEITLRAGAGYKDNVTLSPSPTLASGFFTSGLDILVHRLPLDGWEVIGLVTGDDTRYWNNVGVDGEDFFAASIQAQKFLGVNWRLGAEMRYSYINQVQYVLLDTGPTATKLRGHILDARPFFRRELGTNWWLQAEALISREYFASPLDDSWKVGPHLLLGRTLGSGSTLSLGYAILQEPHDTRLTTDASGNPVPSGKTLTLLENRVDLRWEKLWDPERHWRTVTRLIFRSSQDNGAGFYDFYGYYLNQELRFQTRNWHGSVAAKIGFQDFPVQTIDPSVPGSPKLQRAPLDITFRVERRLYKSLRLYASYEWDSTLSNLASDSYTANTLAAGLTWDF